MTPAASHPYPAYRPSGVPWLGDVPEHWGLVRLKHAVQINPEVLSEDTDPEYLFDYMDINSVSTGYISTPPVRQVFGNAPSRARRVMRTGDTAISTVRTYLKASYHLQRDWPDLIASTGFAVLRPPVRIVPALLGHIVQSDAFVPQVVANSVGVAYPAISETKLGTLFLVLPPLPEQAAIVRYLDYVDRRIRRYVTAKRKLIALLEEEKQAVINRAVTRGLDPNVHLRPSGIEWLGDVPAHWEILPLKRWVSTKITDGPHETPALLDNGIPFMSAESMVGGRLDFSRRRGFISREQHEVYCRKCRPQRDDIFMCKSGATTGKIAIVETTDEFSVWSPLALIRVDPQRVLTHLLFAALQARYVQQQVQDTWSYGTQPNLSMGAMERLVVVLPPIDEQREVHAHLDRATRSLSEPVDRAQRAITLLQEYRTRLIADVVTGKLDVREAAAQLPDEALDEPPDDTAEPCETLEEFLDCESQDL